MESKKVLFLASDAKSRDILPRALHDQSPEIALEVFGRVTDALNRLAAHHFDAAVCCVDKPDELAYVIRLKKRRPELPVVLLSRVTEQGFEALAESMGASAVVRKTSGLSATAKALALALKTRALVKQTTLLHRRTAELSHELQKLARMNRKLIGDALGVVAGDERIFLTLIVEDDPGQALLLIRALAKAKLPPFLRSVSSVAEAKAYLSGLGRYQDREAYPFPALVITDLNLPQQSGLDLLEWMRERPETHLLGVIMLTSSEEARDMDEAFRRGANLYLVKRMDTREVVDAVREVYARFAKVKFENDAL